MSIEIPSRHRVTIALVGLTGVLALQFASTATAGPPRSGPAVRGLWQPRADHAATAAVTVQPAGNGWTVEPTANPTTPTGFLDAVDCASTCAAVGYAEDAAGTLVPLAEERDGTSWARESTPAPDGAAQSVLDGVSCPATGACAAVGFSTDSAGVIHTVAERRSGGTWRLQPVPDPSGALGSGLFAVSCAAPDACLAVGTYNRSDGTPATLAESWNGATWTIRAPRNPGGATAAQLSAVSCPSAQSCITTGNYRLASGAERTLAESWNGATWTLEPTSDPTDAVQSNLLSVSCPAIGACVTAGYAVGSDGTTSALAGFRDPATNAWTLAPVATPSRAMDAELSAVSCTSATACTAGGTASDGPLAERWDGHSWAAEATHSPSGSGFAGLSCASGRQCIAVGFGRSNGNYALPLAEHWNGSGWTVDAVPSPPGATTANLLGVSCPDACLAVGYRTAPDDTSTTLAERSPAGGGFTLRDTPSPNSLNSVLDAVSCPSATACTAVGYYYRSTGDRTLAESWNGHRWTIQATPAVPGAVQGTDLRAVSCSAPDACTAVGEYLDSTGTSIAFAERWDGARWRVQAVPPPDGTTSSTLSGIACPTATSCLAVGDAARSSGKDAPLAESWDGHSWHPQYVPVPAHAVASRLTGISCVSDAACIAVGSYVATGGDELTLTEVRKASGWSVEQTPNQPGAVATILNAVSCTAVASCTAVGYYYDLGSNGHPLPPVAFAATQTGAGWASRPLPSPSGTGSSVLSAVSCSHGHCTATGYRFAPSGRQVTFALYR